jgi:pimeloyl-ACP methyl ester carboxylesterase
MHLAGNRLLLGAVFALVFASLAAADAVYFKDGFTLHGRVRREADEIVDPLTGAVIPIIKGSNFFIVDDRVRWVIFDHRSVQNADPDVHVRRDFLEFAKPLGPGMVSPLPKMARVLGSTPFDDNWQRIVKLRGELGQYSIRQRITQLTPYSARVDSYNYRWNLSYLTQELGLDTVLHLLANHPDLEEKKDQPPDIEKRMKRFRFLLQGNWLMAAEQELSRALADLPQEKERIERSRRVLREAQTQALWNEADGAYKAGRYSAARNIVTRFPLNEADQRMAGQILALRTKFETASRKIEQAQKSLARLLDRLAGPPPFADALPTIQESLAFDTIERLDAFISLAEQHESEIDAGKKPTHSLEEILALAVTGFALGNAAAEPNVAAAERLWSAREFVLLYLRTHEPSARRRALEAYQSGRTLALDELAQLILLLPPPEAPPGLELSPGFQERTTSATWGRGSTPYTLLLPREYSPTRFWPALVVMPGMGERPADALTRWAELAQEYGFVLVSPHWPPGAQAYTHSSEEHQPALEVIRELRRLFQVDPDRLFLAGFADAGTIATDIALGHPDLFAGVVTINAVPPRSTSTWYWHNAQYLPFYIVSGELAGTSCRLNRLLFENWMMRGYPSLMTIYKGRWSEFYPAELPFAFDWMSRKRRAAGFPELGRSPNLGSLGEEMQTARLGDNRFYWLEATLIHPRYVSANLGTVDNKPYTPAALQGTIRDSNTIAVSTRGIRSLRVWLGQAFDPQVGWKTMVDLSQPVTFLINRQAAKVQKFTPDLAVMLEDLYNRGDRHRLYWGSIEFTNLQ